MDGGKDAVVFHGLEEGEAVACLVVVVVGGGGG